MNYLARISFCAALGGMLVYAYHHQWLIIRSPWQAASAQWQQTINAHKKTVKLWHYRNGTAHAETQQLIWDEEHAVTNAERLINAYLHLLTQENILDKKITVQTIACNTAGSELYVNLTHNPFDAQEDIAHKWMFVEGLLRTVREQLPALKTVMLLVNHRPLADHHLDFSRPWPVEGFLHVEQPKQTLSHKQRGSEPFTIMLEPAGDAQYTGRIIDDAFERGMTLQCAQELKKILESTTSNTRIILSRFPGEILEPLQNATFANRLKTDLYISLNMYQLPATQQIMQLRVYHFLYHPVTDFWHRTQAALACEPYHQAHLPYAPTSALLAQQLCQELKKAKPFAAQVGACAGLPVKPLVGVAAPALLIELGLAHKNDWQEIVVQLAHQIAALVNALTAN